MTHEEIRAIARPVKRIADPEVREEMLAAGVIFGCDTASDGVTLFYGKEMLEDIAKGRTAEFDPALIMAFALDFRTSDLEYLVAAVTTLRGSCCYE